MCSSPTKPPPSLDPPAPHRRPFARRDAVASRIQPCTWSAHASTTMHTPQRRPHGCARPRHPGSALDPPPPVRGPSGPAVRSCTETGSRRAPPRPRRAGLPRRCRCSSGTDPISARRRNVPPRVGGGVWVSPSVEIHVGHALHVIGGGQVPEVPVAAVARCRHHPSMIRGETPAVNIRLVAVGAGAHTDNVVAIVRAPGTASIGGEPHTYAVGRGPQ
mmetsp:Transcript_25512/g.39493  ORF Transcript_25512/g.39493 Transcript_25512/m.39493 type:complete len:217 (+) Transcript_25512:113-763(+)